MWALLLLAGCQRQPRPDLAVVAGDPTAPADECDLPCFVVEVRLEGEPLAETPVTATLADGRDHSVVITDADGRAEICPAPGSIAPGEAPLRLTVGAATLDVALDPRPFGWYAGLSKESGAPASLAWTPDLVPPASPILSPVEGTWYARQVTHPHLGDDGLLAFAGSATLAEDDEQNPYQLGVARWDGEAVSEVPEAPLFVEDPDAFGAAARNSPELHRGADGRLVLWFQGREDGEAHGRVGRALSEDDGATWSIDPASPVYEGDGAATHPTLVDHGDGLVELWHAAEGGIGYALSEDGGATFRAFCANPVLDRTSAGAQKAPNVVLHEGRYLMALTRGVSPEWTLTWAESLDGLRWTEREAPVLSAGTASWNDLGVAGAQILVEDDGLALLFVGTGRGGDGGIGIARGE